MVRAHSDFQREVGHGEAHARDEVQQLEEDPGLAGPRLASEHQGALQLVDGAQEPAQVPRPLEREIRVRGKMKIMP